MYVVCVDGEPLGKRLLEPHGKVDLIDPDRIVPCVTALAGVPLEALPSVGAMIRRLLQEESMTFEELQAEKRQILSQIRAAGISRKDGE